MEVCRKKNNNKRRERNSPATLNLFSVAVVSFPPFMLLRFVTQFVPQQKPSPASSKTDSESSLGLDKTLPSFCRAASSSPSHLRWHLFESPPAEQQFGHVLGQAKKRIESVNATKVFHFIFTMLSLSSSMADISFPNCFKLSAITCSSSVCVDPMHSKLNSFKLFASVLWHRDKSDGRWRR